jgi:hypothetical protein
VERLGRPAKYLKPSEDKDAIARQIVAEQKISSGPVCVIKSVEPCWSYDIYRSREEKKLKLVKRPRGSCDQSSNTSAPSPASRRPSGHERPSRDEHLISVSLTSTANHQSTSHSVWQRRQRETPRTGNMRKSRHQSRFMPSSPRK